MLIIYIFSPSAIKRGNKADIFSHILNSAAIAYTDTWDTFCGILRARLVSVPQDAAAHLPPC